MAWLIFIVIFYILAGSATGAGNLTTPIISNPTNVPDRFVTVILENKLGREARVMPSKGNHKKQGYMVAPHSYIKVSIIIKGEINVKPITFRGEDVKTETTLLLNKSLSPISVTPSDAPDVVTKITITAEAPHAKTLQYWLLSSLRGSSVAGSPSLSAHGKFRYVDDGLAFDGSTSFMDTHIESSHCLHNTDNCSTGFSFGTALRIGKAAITHYTERKFILDTGGHGKETQGVSLSVEDTKLVAVVTLKNMKYKASIPLVLDQWIYVMVSFKKDIGLLLYYDAILRSMDDTGSPVSDTHPVNTDKNLVIGRNIEGQPYKYTAFEMASITVSQEYLNQGDVDRAFLFFWGGNIQDANDE